MEMVWEMPAHSVLHCHIRGGGGSKVAEGEGLKSIIKPLWPFEVELAEDVYYTV